MRRAFAAMAVTMLALAGCGGHSYKVVSKSGQREYKTAHGPAAHSPTFGLPPKNVALRPALSSTPSVLMFDTTDNSFSGLSPQAAGGYTSGHWPTYFWMVRTYRGLNSIGRVVSINVGAGHHGKCLDVEPGDATASESAGWVRRDFMSGFKRPCVYANLSTMPSVRWNLSHNGLHQCSATQFYCYLLWDADWTRRDHLDAGYNCTQWDSSYHGRNIDPSRCATTFYQAAHAPSPPPPSPFNRDFRAGFQRGFVVHWDRLHHRRVPPLGRVRVTHAWQVGYNRGYDRAHR